jgi:hypothetical protein
MFVIVMNGTQLVQDGQNNKLVYKFPNSVVLKDKYIAVSSISMYYSWFNITALYNNNTFSYTWTAGVTTTTYTITIPDGLWDITAINNYIQFTCIANKTYWTLNGSNVYPFEIIINANRYAIQLNTYYIPTALPTGATTPVGFPGFPTTAFNPIVTFPANFNALIGYSAGFASANNVGGVTVFGTPSASSNYATKDSTTNTISYLSNVAPNLQPNSSVLFSMSNINNPYTQPSSIIYSLNSSVAVGGLISEKPPNFMWNKMIDGTYNELRLTFLSSNLTPLIINDPNMTILLTIRDKDEAMLGAK